MRAREIPIWHCPACGERVADKAPRCPACRFTGQDTIDQFGDTFPPFKSIMDFAECWTDSEISAIRKAQHHLRRKFPQVRLHVESIALPESASLSTYGMWRVNTAPLGTHETSVHRTWALLLVVDVPSGKASITCGYRISHWLRDSEWCEVMEPMRAEWQKGKRGDAVCAFLAGAERRILEVWKVQGIPKQ